MTRTRERGNEIVVTVPGGMFGEYFGNISGTVFGEILGGFQKKSLEFSLDSRKNQ